MQIEQLYDQNSAILEQLHSASQVIHFILAWGIESEKNRFLAHKNPLSFDQLALWKSHDKSHLEQLGRTTLVFTKAQLARIKALNYCEEIPLYFHLKNIKKEINEALFYMLLYPNSFELIDYVPTPLQMLHLQCTEKRYITLLLKKEEWLNFNFEGKNVWQFLLHDLSHFARFMENSECKLGQIGFAKFTKTIIDQGLLENLTKTNREFREEFEYIYSDMNAYPVHALKSFKGILKKHLNEPDFNYYFKNTLNYFFKDNSKLQTAYTKLNTPAFNLDDELLINAYFTSYPKVL